MVLSNNINSYSRINNILYCDSKPIIIFTKHKFPDFNPLVRNGLAYMQIYINLYPDYWEEYKQQVVETGQITLAL
jgi:hypothetical protein